eukprot:6567-Heterococcus_DN1.PRE.4
MGGMVLETNINSILTAIMEQNKLHAASMKVQLSTPSGSSALVSNALRRIAGPIHIVFDHCPACGCYRVAAVVVLLLGARKCWQIAAIVALLDHAIAIEERCSTPLLHCENNLFTIAAQRDCHYCCCIALLLLIATYCFTAATDALLLICVLYLFVLSHCHCYCCYRCSCRYLNTVIAAAAAIATATAAATVSATNTAAAIITTYYQFVQDQSLVGRSILQTSAYSLLP